jgi:hypothetical protein
MIPPIGGVTMPGAAPAAPTHVISVQAVHDVLRSLEGDSPARDFLSRLQPGDEISATVVAHTRGGDVLDVGPTTIKLKLPNASTQLGAILRLRIVDQSPGSGGEVLPLGESAMRLTALGRTLSRLAAANDANASTPVHSAALPEDPSAAGEYAPALERAVTASGLFYESHLESWLDGRRQISDLLREPQARFATASAGAGAANAASGEIDALPDELAGMVQRQLAVLDSSAALWRMEIWPGQFAQLTIERDAEAADQSRAGVPCWHAKLKLDLPQLGALECLIALRGEQAGLVLKCATQAAVKRLAEASPTLVVALEASSSGKASVEVRHDGP